MPLMSTTIGQSRNRQSRSARHSFGGRGGSRIPTHLAHALVASHDGDARAARLSLDQALNLYEEPSLTVFPWLGAQMAIGLGRMLGVTLPENFNSPYKARSIGEYQHSRS